MMTSQDKYDAIEGTICNLPDRDIISLWNDYCDNRQYPCERIYPMDEFDEHFANTSPSDIARMVHYNKFDCNAPYFYYDGLDNACSLWSIDNESIVDFKNLAEWVSDYPNLAEASLYIDENDLKDEFTLRINLALTDGQDDSKYTYEELLEMGADREDSPYVTSDILEDDWTIWLKNIQYYLDNSK